MSGLRYSSSRPHQSVVPRPSQDASLRYRAYGALRPMDKPSFLERIFGKH